MAFIVSCFIRFSLFLWEEKKVKRGAEATGGKKTRRTKPSFLLSVAFFPLSLSLSRVCARFLSCARSLARRQPCSSDGHQRRARCVLLKLLLLLVKKKLLLLDANDSFALSLSHLFHLSTCKTLQKKKTTTKTFSSPRRPRLLLFPRRPPPDPGKAPRAERARSIERNKEINVDFFQL